MKGLNRLFLVSVVLVVFGVAETTAEGQPNRTVFAFTENKGQWNENILFQLSTPNTTIFLEKTGIRFDLRNRDDLNRIFTHPGPMPTDSIGRIIHGHRYSVTFNGANPAVSINATNPSESKSNYYVGNNPDTWAAGVRSFSEVTYQSIYEGIDLHFYIQNGQLKYDFILAKDANPAQISLSYEGVDALSLTDGNLYIATSVDTLIETKPICFQRFGENVIQPLCQYVVTGNTLSYLFPLGYTPHQPLVIDPGLVFSSYTGSLADNWGFTAAFDRDGNLYTGGRVYNDVPARKYNTTTGAYQTSFQGGEFDMAISKFNAQGSQLLYSTYLGGSKEEEPHSLIVNSKDQLIIYGTTNSANFPITKGTYDSILNVNAGETERDMVLIKFTEEGQLAAATFIGGSQSDGINVNDNELAFGEDNLTTKFNYGDEFRGEVFVDINDDVYVGAVTYSTNFPVKNAIQATLKGQQDACIFKLTEDLKTLRWSTYLGGSSFDVVNSILVKDSNTVYITGGTASTDFPSTASAYQTTYKGGIVDGFVCKIDQNGTRLAASSFIGTSEYDQCFFVQSGKKDSIYLFGQTKGTYPVTAGKYSNYKGKQFIHKLSPDLATSVFSTVFGADTTRPDISPSAFLVDQCGYMYATGWGGYLGSFVNPPSKSGSVKNLPVTTSGGTSPSTDTKGFYLLALDKEATGITFGAVFASGGTITAHADGGTSRFDRKGIIYQSVCAGCGGSNSFVGSPSNVVSTTNKSSNCNNGVFKYDILNPIAVAEFKYESPNRLCAGDSVTFLNRSLSSFSYVWDFGDGSPKVTTGPGNIKHFYPIPGKYLVKLKVADPFKCNVTDSIAHQITIREAPQLLLTVHSATICADSIIQLSAQGINGLKWSPATGLDNPNSNTPKAKPAITTSYIVTPPAESCFQKDTVVITVKQHLVADFQVLPDSICAKATMVFEAVDTANSQYEWSFPGGASSTSKKPGFVFNGAGKYPVQLIVKNALTCEASDTLVKTVTVFSEFAINLTLFDTICKKDTIQLKPLTSLSGASFKWSPDIAISSLSGDSVKVYPLQDQQYQVIAKIYNCLDTAIISLNVKDSLKANALVEPEKGCAPLKIKLVALDSINSTIQWVYNTNVISTNKIVLQELMQLGKYDFVLKLNNQSTCNATDSIVKKVEVLEGITFPSHPDIVVCQGDSSTVFDVSLGSTIPATYQWKPTTFISDPTSSRVHFSPPTTTRYTVVASFNNCIDSISLNVAVKKSLRPKFNVAVNPCTDVQFTNSTADATAYSWDFGDKSQSTKTNPVHSYKDTGVYKVTLTVSGATDICGASRTQEVRIKELPGLRISVPDVFTPDGDGVNDVFEIQNADRNCVFEHITIFSRWGVKVYENDAAVFWDGKVNNAPAPDGVYYYVLAGNGYEKSGFVSLLNAP